MRTARFVWKWRTKLWAKAKRIFKEIHEDIKVQFNIPKTYAALYKTPAAFVISIFGREWVRFAVKMGHKRLTLFFVNLMPKGSIDEYDLIYMIKRFSNTQSIDCIVAATLTGEQKTVDEIFEFVTLQRYHYHSNALADFAVNENAYISLVQWKHDAILERITHKYDPTFLCWVGLAFDRKTLFNQNYPLANHDQLLHMIECNFYGSGIHKNPFGNDYILFPQHLKEQTLMFLQQQQRNKLMACVEQMGDTKKRKM